MFGGKKYLLHAVSDLLLTKVAIKKLKLKKKSNPGDGWLLHNVFKSPSDKPTCSRFVA